MFDAIDIEILTILQQNARTPNAEIARRIGMAPSAVLERIRKLEDRGVILGYEARIDPRAIGVGLTAFVFVRASERAGATDTAKRLVRLAEVQEVHHVAGEDCLLAKVRVADTAALGTLLNERIGAIKTVASTRTTVVLGTLKESARLPLPVAPADGSRG